MKTLIHNCKQLLTITDDNNIISLKRNKLTNPVIKTNSSVLIEDDKIIEVAKKENFNPNSYDKVINAENLIVTPGLIDSHTHTCHAGIRSAEFAKRCAGVSYQEIAAAGGGIKFTVKETRKASIDELKMLLLKRLDIALSHGITSIEIKSGYGLNTENEIKMLKTINEASEEHPMTIKASYLGAHEVPPDMNKEEYINQIENEHLPQIKEEKLASFVDVFCEKGVYSIEETERIVKKAKDFGLKPKLHVDQFVDLGGSELAAELGALSADHLENISEKGIKKLSESETIATVLPGVSFYLPMKYAPIKEIVDAGCALCIATDFNPGSCMSENIFLMMTIACVSGKISPATAWSATTYNAAASIGLQDEIGSIAKNKKADMLLLDIPSYEYPIYHFGSKYKKIVIKNGKIVYSDGLS